MARQSGSNVKARLKRQTAWGTTATGNFVNFPFYSKTLGAEQALEDVPLLGVSPNRDPGAPQAGPINAGGDIVLPVDLINIGYFLTAMFGSPTSSGTTDYTHTFKSGAATIPAYTIEFEHPSVPRFELYPSCMVNSLAFSWSREGRAECTANLIAQTETRGATTGGGTPTTNALTLFQTFQGSIKRGGSTFGCTGATFTFSNNLDTIPEIRSDGFIGGADPTITSARGSLTVRYADEALITDAINGTSVSLELGYVISATQSLLFTVHDVRLSRPKVNVQGPQGIELSVDFIGYYNAANTAMVTAVLKNQSAGTVYA